MTWTRAPWRTRMRSTGAPSGRTAWRSWGTGTGAFARIRSRARPEAVRGHRLQQVVDRVHLEGLERVLVEGGDEDDRLLPPDQLEHLEPRELRHLDVEEHEVGLQLRDRLHRLEAVAALPHELDPG